MTIRIKLTLFIVFLFLTVIGNSVFTFKMETFEEEKLRWVIHTHEVLITTEKLLSSLKDTERGQRGLLLTQNPSYLDIYHAGLLNVKDHFRKLRILTSDNQQQQRLDTVQTLIALKFEKLAATISLSALEPAQALELVKQDESKQFMDKIKVQLTDFNNDELLLLEQRKGIFKAHRAQIVTLMIAEMVFFIVLAILTIPFLNRNFFSPLKLLIANTHKMEAGEKIDISDMLSKDEMGYLLARFYTMNEAIHSRTEKLNYQAHHDLLTGLKNRNNLFADLEKTIQLKKGSNLKCGVCFIDLNKFKQLNDTFGHDAGDSVLIEAANRIQNSIRTDDHIYRIGGDEFIVLIQAVKSQSEVNKIIQTILAKFESPMVIQNQSIEISLSTGIAIVPDDSTNSEEVINYADIAMYAAKNDQQTHYKFFDRSMLKRSSDT
ncbi:diguanylate cyclase [Methylophaga sp. 41_12_T18]|nr:diguanylate cyclase [Methylophaga sp. 41_12_T18]